MITLGYIVDFGGIVFVVVRLRELEIYWSMKGCTGKFRINRLMNRVQLTAIYFTGLLLKLFNYKSISTKYVLFFPLSYKNNFLTICDKILALNDSHTNLPSKSLPSQQLLPQRRLHILSLRVYFLRKSKLSQKPQTWHP